MIDFEKELAKFDFAAVDAEFTGQYSEAAPAVEVCAATLKRIGRELHGANMQMEEVLSFLGEDAEKDKLLAENKKKVTLLEEEKMSLVRGLITTLDQLEHIYRYTVENEQGSWAEQIKLLWNSAATDLMSLGLTRIEGEQTRFDVRFHVAVQVQEHKEIQDGMILAVLRCGYLYQNQLLRKAEVVVNRNEGGSF